MIQSTTETRSPLAATAMMAPAYVDRLQRRALLIGIIFGVGTIIGAVLQPHQFFRSYLLAFMMWLGVTLGGLALLQLQYLTKGNWGFVIRRLLEASSRLIPLMALFFVPLVIPMLTGQMFPWAISYKTNGVWHGLNLPGGLTAEQAKAPKFTGGYMTPHSVIARAVVYFLLWFVMATLLNRWGRWQDERDEPDLPRSRRYQTLSAPGIIIYAYTISLAVTDWVQSLDPTWYSTMFGLVFVDGEAMIAMTFCIMVTYWLARYKPTSDIMQPLFWHDLGNMTLAMVMLFAYFGFSQFLIIWSGNLPEEIDWFINRVNGGWGVWAMLMVFTQFAIPFFLLLMKPLKRNASKLVWIAALLFLARYIDLIWYIMPNFPAMEGLPATRESFFFSWQNIVIPIAMGGLWISAFCWQLKKRPLYPVYDLLWPEITKHYHGY